MEEYHVEGVYGRRPTSLRFQRLQLSHMSTVTCRRVVPGWQPLPSTNTVLGKGNHTFLTDGLLSLPQGGCLADRVGMGSSLTHFIVTGEPEQG